MQNGVQAWMSSIRLSMDNDACRKLFEDQAQTHAFIFLDDYLESILTGPKQGPIIELVKTPGRKKHAPHRTRAATAAAAVRAQNIVSFSLDDDSSTKENLPPVNSFHKALLRVKEEAVHEKHRPFKSSETVLFSDSGPVRPAAVHERVSRELSNSTTINDVPEITVADCSVQDRLGSQPSPKLGCLLSQNSGERQSLAPPPFPIGRGTSELSMIAEDDESPERTRANTVPPSLVQFHAAQSSDEPHAHYAVAEAVDNKGHDNIHCVRDESSHDPDDAIIASANTFHSICLDSPSQVRAGNHTEPLPSVSHHTDALTAPLPDSQVYNSAPALTTMFVPLNDSLPKTHLQKNRTSGFPTLPAPSPLRKSMRVLPQEAAGGTVPPYTTPAPVPAPLGKRTSWLTKAREAKAMEGTMTRSSNHENISMAAGSSAIVAPPASSTLKRKSDEMLGTLPHSFNEHEVQRSFKAAKVSDAGTAPLIVMAKEKVVDHEISTATTGPPAPAPAVFSFPHIDHLTEQIMPLNADEEGLISQFKRTVEGLGTRGGKSVNKSSGGDSSAAAALAEARAAAEARVAERNKDIEKSAPLREHAALQHHSLPSGSTEEPNRHLSVSDLMSSSEKIREANREVFSAQLGPKFHGKDGDESISTTPPNSPPSQRSSSLAKPIDPVLNKLPQPVFMPPFPMQPSTVADLPKEFPVNQPPSTLTLPTSVRLASLPVAPFILPPMTQQSDSGPSDAVSDQKIPTWITSSQDTEDMPSVGSQPPRVITDMVDEDDSWPLEKLAAAEQGWKPFDFNDVDREDTWSTIPTESQGPTRCLTGEKETMQADLTGALATGKDEGDRGKPEQGQGKEIKETSDAHHASVTETVDMEEMVRLDPFTISLLKILQKPRIVGSNGQSSVVSTASSSQAQVGFFSQATKLVNSMLGGPKKTKPEVKSLQLAAAAAKKQQEEADKKAQRFKEMEARRQAALARKAEEKTRVMDEEKKIREEGERRKREREENTDKKPLKLPTTVSKKVDEDMTKKRKIAVEGDKKFPFKDKKDNLSVSKLVTTKASLATPATKIGTAPASVKFNIASALVSSAAYNATLKTSSGSSTTKPMIPEAKPFKVVSASLKGKAKAKPRDDDIGDKLPSTMVHTQMAARVKAQIEAAKPQTPEVPSETIELPDINSEYSDSEDEDRVRTFDPPEWAQSPELRQALQIQSTINPDDIFGAIRPLRMEEIFRTRQSRFRARTSSANWSGMDRLTAEEVREYERRMGFQRSRAS
ncbi:hypothetical protein F5I97DRAFT_1814551 [Phlebopus sp. FC_14]|nr:hypothetical protein F5I97DRAFT_1814551 [Phlebopus sp. FC_14]